MWWVGQVGRKTGSGAGEGPVLWPQDRQMGQGAWVPKAGVKEEEVLHPCSTAIPIEAAGAVRNGAGAVPRVGDPSIPRCLLVHLLLRPILLPGPHASYLLEPSPDYPYEWNPGAASVSP